MQVLKAASTLDLTRLLGLFPKARLKERWPEVKGTKIDLAQTLAQQRHRDELMGFVHDNLSCCRQHVYVFSHSEPLKRLPEKDLSSADRVLKVEDQHALYLIKVRLDVILRDPLEEDTLEFLWPFRTDIVRGYLVYRFTKT
jgi:hypothetical protein